MLSGIGDLPGTTCHDGLMQSLWVKGDSSVLSVIGAVGCLRSLRVHAALDGVT
jgi:hypothetical protein